MFREFRCRDTRWRTSWPRIPRAPSSRSAAGLDTRFDRVDNGRAPARDALHVAVMRQHGVEEILSFDRAFDVVPDIRRLAG